MICLALSLLSLPVPGESGVSRKWKGREGEGRATTLQGCIYKFFFFFAFSLSLSPPFLVLSDFWKNYVYTVSPRGNSGRVGG